MGLPGETTNEEMDFPRAVRETVSLLPFFSGGTTTLSVTDVPEDLVLVSALRRFENRTYVAEGTHTATGNAAVLTDSTADFVNWGVGVGDTVFNDTDGSSAVITAVDATTITGVLSGGTDDDWDTSDVYHVNKTLVQQSSRAQEIRKIRIHTDLECYIAIDGEAGSTRHLYHLLAGAAINEEDIRVVSRISVINVVTGETPAFKFAVWGI